MPAVKRQEIRQRRQRLGLKVSELAEAAGVNPKTLANIEASGQTVSIEVVWKLANFFKVDADELLVKAADAA